MAQRPGPFRAFGILVDAIEHTGVAQETIRCREAALHLAGSELGETGGEVEPVRSHAALRVDHLIVAAGQWPVARQETAQQFGMLSL